MLPYGGIKTVSELEQLNSAVCECLVTGCEYPSKSTSLPSRRRR